MASVASYVKTDEFGYNSGRRAAAVPVRLAAMPQTLKEASP